MAVLWKGLQCYKDTQMTVHDHRDTNKIPVHDITKLTVELKIDNAQYSSVAVGWASCSSKIYAYYLVACFGQLT